MVDHSVSLSPSLQVASLRKRKVPSPLLVIPGEWLIVPLFVNQARLMCMATIQMQTALIIQLRSRKAREAAQMTSPSDESLIRKFAHPGVLF
jgi:hypothetical protein